MEKTDQTRSAKWRWRPASICINHTGVNVFGRRRHANDCIALFDAGANGAQRTPAVARRIPAMQMNINEP